MVLPVTGGVVWYSYTHTVNLLPPTHRPAVLVQTRVRVGGCVVLLKWIGLD